ncbi:hypothetical protein [Phormidium tenue]|uniref:Cell division protein FtsL n=1 Tax=Phormidium tenue NIES-30 TaxID=549789 RepID=A0A1U7J1N7_9CYAN|nr:hypothetical protein [Phormidium tenue]MBD2232202.1 hypothetical protein [Phormidium tenue FACHB-1052]OKH45855.1 hypothetical protein NIES30_18415 [Phormidium tenue NIES-30]
MSAALKSYVPRPVPSRSTAATAHAQGYATQPAETRPEISAPVVLPQAPGLDSSSPVVRRLAQLHLVSSALATSLVALTLLSYGTSVYINRQLNQASQQLNRLQRNEQQLTTANEVLKNHLAQQVEGSEMGFQPPQPGSVIFLKPAQQAAVAMPVPASTSLLGRLALPKVDVPLGY